jgi:hypothetical protein
MVQGHDTAVGAQTDYVCYYELIATASGGSAGQVATWGSGHYTEVLTATGETFSGTIGVADAYFGYDPVVPAGTRVSGNDYGYWTGPYSLSLTFYYSTPETSEDSATYHFACQ